MSRTTCPAVALRWSCSLLLMIATAAAVTNPLQVVSDGTVSGFYNSSAIHQAGQMVLSFATNPAKVYVVDGLYGMQSFQVDMQANPVRNTLIKPFASELFTALAAVPTWDSDDYTTGMINHSMPFQGFFLSSSARILWVTDLNATAVVVNYKSTSPGQPYHFSGAHVVTANTTAAVEGTYYIYATYPSANCVMLLRLTAALNKTRIDACLKGSHVDIYGDYVGNDGDYCGMALNETETIGSCGSSSTTLVDGVVANARVPKPRGIVLCHSTLYFTTSTTVLRVDSIDDDGAIGSGAVVSVVGGSGLVFTFPAGISLVRAEGTSDLEVYSGDSVLLVADAAIGVSVIVSSTTGDAYQRLIIDTRAPDFAGLKGVEHAVTLPDGRIVGSMKSKFRDSLATYCCANNYTPPTDEMQFPTADTMWLATWRRRPTSTQTLPSVVNEDDDLALWGEDIGDADCNSIPMTVRWATASASRVTMQNAMIVLVCLLWLLM